MTGFFWSEGIVQGPGDHVFGAPSPFSPANFVDRNSSAPWLNPGGDPTTGSPLATRKVSCIGTNLFSSSALVGAAQDAIDFGDLNDGFKLSGPADLFARTSVVFASDDFPFSLQRPTFASIPSAPPSSRAARSPAKPPPTITI